MKIQVLFLLCLIQNIHASNISNGINNSFLNENEELPKYSLIKRITRITRAIQEMFLTKPVDPQDSKYLKINNNDKINKNNNNNIVYKDNIFN